MVIKKKKVIDDSSSDSDDYSDSGTMVIKDTDKGPKVPASRPYKDWTVEQIQAATEAQLIISPDLKSMLD